MDQIRAGHPDHAYPATAFRNFNLKFELRNLRNFEIPSFRKILLTEEKLNDLCIIA